MEPYFEFSPTKYLTLRFWQEPLGEGTYEWRGYVFDIKNQQGRFFRDWPALLAFLEQALAEAAAGEV